MLTSDGREIVRCDNVRYLGVRVVSSKSFTCSFNTIYGRLDHITSEAVIVQLLKSKYLPTLLYLRSADVKGHASKEKHVL